MTTYRDGRIHQIGPITIQFRGLSAWGPYGLAVIASREGVAFRLGWGIAETLAYCIRDSAHLWTAKENGMRLQPATGEERGLLRLDLTDDQLKLGDFSAFADKHFFVARLVADAGPGEIVRPVLGYRTTDYHLEAFRKVSGRSQQASRREFVELAGILARHYRPDLSDDWEEQMLARFAAADALHEEIAAQHREIDEEDETARLFAAEEVVR